jgi:hypothetical protein
LQIFTKSPGFETFVVVVPQKTTTGATSAGIAVVDEIVLTYRKLVAEMTQRKEIFG